MNKRAKELCMQANAFVKDNAQRGMSVEELADMHASKFVELIVRDCAQVCVDQMPDNDETTWADICAVSVLERFGLLNR